MRLRWDELSPMERRHFANVAVDLMSEIANPCEEWALKSQTSALVAEVLYYFHSNFTRKNNAFPVVVINLTFPCR